RDGNNLRGSDQLNYSGAPGQIPIEVIIRFHLHPQVSAARVKSKQILLKVHNQKAGWLFKCRGAETALDRSVYLDRNRRRSCQQIVLRCPASQIQTKGNLTINWAFTRHSS
ncbi:MAG: heparinase II/III domain-containing protein, partial [Candidatus Puniceispirillaceae bacterium]